MLFLAAYIAWLILRPREFASRLLVGNLAVFAPLVTSVVLIFLILPKIDPRARSTWQFVGLALTFWAVGGHPDFL